MGRLILLDDLGGSAQVTFPFDNLAYLNVRKERILYLNIFTQRNNLLELGRQTHWP